jgi:predicted small metal-binding protein
MFKLACGDVMPGCAARFENTDRDQLMAQVAAHAASVHGVNEFTPDLLRTVEAQVTFAA